MFTVFKSTLTPMLLMFICILIGYILKKKNILPDNSDVTLSKLETCVFLPALNISTFMNNCTIESLVKYRSYVVISLIVILAAILISYPLSKSFSKEDYQRNIYKYALTFGNFGFLGNAIVPIIMGEEYLYPYLLFTMFPTMFCYIWGLNILIPKGENKSNPFKNLVNPSVLSIAIGILLGLTGARNIVPQFIKLTLSNLTACMGPVAMILTGFVVAKYSFSFLLKKPPVYFTSLFRLVIIPFVFLTALILLKVDGTIIKLAFFMLATPLGLNTVVFPSAYGGDASTGASMALISHALSIITFPLMYAILSIVV